MKTKFILLNGHPGSGKSTISRAVAAKIPRLAVLDVDMFRKFVSDYGFKPKDIRLGWEVAFAVIEVYLRNGISVLADRCIPDNGPKLKLKRLANRFNAEYCEVVLYTTTLKTAFDRVKNRPAKQLSRFKKKLDKPRITTLRQAMLDAANKPNVVAIDTEAVPLESVVDRIAKLFR